MTMLRTSLRGPAPEAHSPAPRPPAGPPGTAWGLAFALLLSPAVQQTATATGPATTTAAASPDSMAPVTLFTDITRRSGIDFLHQQGTRMLYLPQVMGPGCALLDFDGDGWLDALMVQGSGQERPTGTAPGTAPVSGAVLWRNRGDGTFEDVTARAGLDAHGWGMGVLAADFTGQGTPDLVFSYYGQPPTLWHNEGDGTFRRRTAAFPPTSFGPHPWSTGLVALDTERRGVLDLYVCNYVDWGPDRFIKSPPLLPLRGSMQPSTLSPYLPPPQGSVLLRNEAGDAVGGARVEAKGGKRERVLGAGPSFRDVTARAGVANIQGKALAAVVLDADDDGWPDLFVADDVTPCALFQNRHDGTFADIGSRAWVAEVRGSMGLAVADYNHDGALDIFCTHWVDEVHALYHSTLAARRRAHARPGPLTFVERGQAAGLGSLPLDLVGWGAAFADVDQDGWEDIVFVCGHTFVDPATGRTIEQPGVALRNNGKASFIRWSDTQIGPLSRPMSARGAAFGDVNRDGALDILIAQCGGPAVLLAGRPQAHWLEIQLVGTTSARDPVGAHLVLQAGGLTQTREVVTGDSYLSSNPRETHFGLGKATEARLTIRWPRGRVQVVDHIHADQVVRLVEPCGQLAP